jgi:hypothetical protein
MGWSLVDTGSGRTLVCGRTHRDGGTQPVTLWAFRVGSRLTQVDVWATLGLLFGALTERATRAQIRSRLLDTSRTAVS